MLDSCSTDFRRSSSSWAMSSVSVWPSEFLQISTIEIHGRNCAGYARRTVKHGEDAFLLHYWWTLPGPTMAASMYLKQERHRLQGAKE